MNRTTFVEIERHAVVLPAILEGIQLSTFSRTLSGASKNEETIKARLELVASKQ